MILLESAQLQGKSAAEHWLLCVELQVVVPVETTDHAQISTAELAIVSGYRNTLTTPVFLQKHAPPLQ